MAPQSVRGLFFGLEFPFRPFYQKMITFPRRPDASSQVRLLESIWFSKMAGLTLPQNFSQEPE